MFKGYSKSKTAQILFKVWFLIPIFIGCISSTEFAWLCADIGTGASCWVTLIAVIFMFPIVRKVWNDYEKQFKDGKDPIFRPDNCGIKNADLWNEIADEYEKKLK